jgi:hypothetical protein
MAFPDGLLTLSILNDLRWFPIIFAIKALFFDPPFPDLYSLIWSFKYSLPSGTTTS